MTDRGLESWAEGSSARERVRDIATTLSQPRSAEWVREEANVPSLERAKGELEMLAELGQVRAIEGGDGVVKYAPNYQLRHFNEVTELINDHARGELREEIATLQEEIDE